MNLVEFKKLLEETGFPVAYSHFPEKKGQRPPFITYLVSPSSNFMADNHVFYKVNNVQVELYTKQKDLSAESKLEAVLDQAEIPYETDEVYIESEKLYQRTYEVSP
jgi:hypothetical protein